MIAIDSSHIVILVFKALSVLMMQLPILGDADADGYAGRCTGDFGFFIVACFD